MSDEPLFFTILILLGMVAIATLGIAILASWHEDRIYALEKRVFSGDAEQTPAQEKGERDDE